MIWLNKTLFCIFKKYEKQLLTAAIPRHMETPN
jgi:hypothetical protein